MKKSCTPASFKKGHKIPRVLPPFFISYRHIYNLSIIISIIGNNISNSSSNSSNSSNIISITSIILLSTSSTAPLLLSTSAAASLSLPTSSPSSLLLSTSSPSCLPSQQIACHLPTHGDARTTTRRDQCWEAGEIGEIRPRLGTRRLLEKRRCVGR